MIHITKSKLVEIESIKLDPNDEFSDLIVISVAKICKEESDSENTFFGKVYYIRKNACLPELYLKIFLITNEDSSSVNIIDSNIAVNTSSYLVVKADVKRYKGLCEKSKERFKNSENKIVVQRIMKCYDASLISMNKIRVWNNLLL